MEMVVVVGMNHTITPVLVADTVVKEKMAILVTVANLVHKGAQLLVTCP